MKTLITLFISFFTLSVVAELPVIPVPAESQAAMLVSDDPQLAKNKRVAYDFWRIVIVARHVDEADKFMTADFKEHNPNVLGGREGVKNYFRPVEGAALKPVKDTIDDLVAIMGEDDLVTMAFARELDDPNTKGRKYYTTWFDMFRIKNGMIIEHWDPATISAH
jgi:predicted SnoaL-like aldol condensation-catalyzing enzyme